MTDQPTFTATGDPYTVTKTATTSYNLNAPTEDIILNPGQYLALVSGQVAIL